jgi:mevalonate kinase
VVGYTGIKADTTTLVKKVAELKSNNPKVVDKIFDLITLIVEEAKRSVKLAKVARLGELANLNQGLLDSLGANTRELSDLILASRFAGAYGGKLSGAGGGDCMIAFVAKNKKLKVEKSISKNQGTVLRIKTAAEGVRLEK